MSSGFPARYQAIVRRAPSRKSVGWKPSSCRAFALEFSWPRSAEQFLDNLRPLDSDRLDRLIGAEAM